MAKYDATEVVLSIIYYSGGAYSPDEIVEIMETIALYDPSAVTDQPSKTGLRIVPINTGDSYD
jgi:hypothetical protein